MAKSTTTAAATRRRAPRPGRADDPHLVELEGELARLRAISRGADEQLASLQTRELQIRREVAPPQPPIDSTLTLGAVVSLKEYFEALRAADFRFYEERDRRYTEVNIEREKALKIKETADLAALSLAREIQDYKDEKANNLRSQIEGERGHYATKDDLKATQDKFETQITPVLSWIAIQQGRGNGISTTVGWILAVAAIAASLSGTIVFLIFHK
jgi:hypothetical protein